MLAVEALLVNWGRWARHGAMPALGVALSAVWDFWRPGLAREPGWGEPAPPEAVQAEYDEAAALRLDAALCRLPARHAQRLKGYYVEDRHYRREEVDESRRALADLLGKIPL